MNKEKKIKTLKAMKELLASERYLYICNTYPSVKLMKQDLPELYEEIQKEIVRTNNLQNIPDLDITKYTINYPIKTRIEGRIALIDRIINKLKIVKL